MKFASIVITSFLAFSGFAQADARQVLVNGSSFEMDFSGTIITASGRFPNPCTSNPQFELNLKSENEIYIDVVANRTGQFCPSVLGTSFSVKVDLSEIKAELSQMALNPSGEYLLIDRTGNFQYVVDFSDVADLKSEKMHTSALRGKGLRAQLPVVRKQLRSSTPALRNLEIITTGY